MYKKYLKHITCYVNGSYFNECFKVQTMQEQEACLLKPYYTTNFEDFCRRAKDCGQLKRSFFFDKKSFTTGNKSIKEKKFICGVITIECCSNWNSKKN